MVVSSIWTLLYPRGVLSIGRAAAPNHPWTADKLALSLLANQAPVTTKLLKTNNGHEILMIPGLASGVPYKCGSSGGDSDEAVPERFKELCKLSPNNCQTLRS